jgi:hypothetical protein
MSADNQYEGLENLLGLTPGSTKLGEEELKPVLAKAIDQKSKELALEVKKQQAVKKLDTQVALNAGITPEQLRADREEICYKAKYIYDIGEAVLLKLKSQMDEMEVSTDKMYTSASTMINTLTNAIDKLFNIYTKMINEIEMERKLEEANTPVKESAKLTLDQHGYTAIMEEMKKKREAQRAAQDASDA